MDNIAIRVENLSKLYRLGAFGSLNKTFREALTDVCLFPFRALRNVFRTDAKAPSPQFLWALNDVSFDVLQGEAIGIIGKNGAGKSTLLKILSRITEPTRGRVEMRGRVGSLLEVGTGFHSELTGEENIYLSGAILGMTSNEISRKFDEIVAFAEVEKFIRTPMKHYSSGMELRLAFSIAAHMEPDILLADEVLAVGDAAYQKKCLGKMGDVAKEGRTVLFVSHNMQAVQTLCEKTMLIDAGKIAAFADSRSVITRYLSDLSASSSQAAWDESSAPGNEDLKLVSLRAVSESGDIQRVYHTSQDVVIEMGFISRTLNPAFFVGFDLKTSQGEVVFRIMQTDLPIEDRPSPQIGKNVWRCFIPKNFLNAGIYYVSPISGIHGMYWILVLEAAIQFEMILDHGSSPRRPGSIVPPLRWDGG